MIHHLSVLWFSSLLYICRTESWPDVWWTFTLAPQDRTLCTVKQCLCLYLLSALTLIGLFVIGRRRLHQSVGRWRERGSRERHVGPAAPIIPRRESSSYVCVWEGKTHCSWFGKILRLSSYRSILKNSSQNCFQPVINHRAVR